VSPAALPQELRSAACCGRRRPLARPPRVLAWPPPAAAQEPRRCGGERSAVADGARPAGCRVEPWATAAPPASSDPREQEATAGRRRMPDGEGRGEPRGGGRGARRRGKSGSRDAGWGLGSVGRRKEDDAAAACLGYGGCVAVDRVCFHLFLGLTWADVRAV